jgi:hypothetical protein
MSTIEDAEQPADDRLGDDLLVGAAAIAKFLDRTEHAVYYIAAKKLLPIGRLGKNLIASKRTLRRSAQALTR